MFPFCQFHPFAYPGIFDPTSQRVSCLTVHLKVMLGDGLIYGTISSALRTSEQVEEEVVSTAYSRWTWMKLHPQKSYYLKKVENLTQQSPRSCWHFLRPALLLARSPC